MENERENYSSQNGAYNGECAKHMGKKILKPIRQEKIVKVPVTEYVEKIIEKEEIKYVNKYVDVIKPVITYKTKHIPKPIYLDKIKYETKILEKEKIIHIPKIEYRNRIVDIPVYVHREKIIEKKVPLIIERVIPVLKVKKSEKEVFLDSIAVPEICEVSHKEKVSKSRRSLSLNESYDSPDRSSVLQKILVPSISKVNEENAANMKTFRLNQASAHIEMNSNMNQEMERSNGFKGENSENSNANSDTYSQGEAEIMKHNTKFHETMDEPINDESSDYGQHIIHINEKFEDNSNILGDGSFYNARDNNNGHNTTRVSVHLPDYAGAHSEYAEQKSSNGYESNYMHLLNNVSQNGQYRPENMYHGNDLNVHSKFVSEQIINNNSVIIDPKMYSSFPMNGNYQENQQHLLKEHFGMGQNYGVEASNIQQSCENYNSMQHIQGHSSSKPNLRPSYANSNGQAMISVRPATIVEYKPKPRKLKNPLCNFLNNCCGGQE